MDTDKTEFEMTVDQSAEALWEEFERTGSVKAYLRFAQKIPTRLEFETADLPVLS